MGGGQGRSCDAKFSEKRPCSHNSNTALIKQIFLFDTASVISRVLIQNKKIRRSKHRHGLSPPPSNTIKEYFTPILLWLNDFCIAYTNEAIHIYIFCSGVYLSTKILFNKCQQI